MSTKHPLFDPTQEYGEIFHGTTEGVDGSTLPRYVQNGNYFKPDKSWHSADQNAPKRVAPKLVAPVDTLPTVDASEVDALLKDPRAEELLALTRDHLVELVSAANGAVISGEGSQQMMVAWLIKHTTPEL